MTFSNRERAGSFGDDASQYHRSRPRYPGALLNDLVTDGVRDAVDVGCGTGILSLQLIDRGCIVVGVEADERMAVVARDHGIDVEVSAFEEWDDSGRKFDLLASGQAWHWIRPDDGARKAATVLRRGGRFAVFWNVPSHRTETKVAFESIYERLAPEILIDSVALGTTGPPEPDDDRDAAALLSTGSFVNVERKDYAWERVYTRDQWLDELPTHSNHRLLPVPLLAELLNEVGRVIDDLGGKMTTDYRTNALFATRS